MFVIGMIPVGDAGAAAWLGASLSARLHGAVVRPIAALALGAAVIAASALPASADFVTTDTTTSTDLTTSATTTLDDPLHGYCTGCAENSVSTNTVTAINPIQNFGFSISPKSLTGDFRIEILVPNNEYLLPANHNFTITGTATNGNTPRTVNSTATLVKTTAWTSGDLSTFVNISNSSPANPIGAYDCGSVAQKCADAFDPGLTGFYVYQADLGSTTLQSQGSGPPYTSPLLNIAEMLPRASYIVAYLQSGSSWIATVNSGAIFARVPEPASLALLSTGLLGFGLARRLRGRRRSVLRQPRT